jgi:hypothetical protein
MLACTLFFACCAAVIAPWTLRNCRAYGRCILVETGLSYNLWAFNEPREDQQTIFRTLEGIPNPAARADYASAKGLARLREDPAILWRKLWPNWTYLWRVKPIEDRFLLPTYYADPPPLVFLAALLFDDALYAALLVFGVAGLVLARPRSRLLCLAWLACVLITTLLTHGEGRYRHFIFSVLLPAAALMIQGKRQKVKGKPFLPFAFYLLPFVLTLLLYTVASTYPWAWAWGGARRSALQLVGDTAYHAGAVGAAQALYERAVAAQETPDAWLRVGDARRAAGNRPGALAAYDEAGGLAPAYVAAAIRRGDLLRELGDTAAAREAFAPPYTEPQTVLDWSWRELHPAPSARVEVGEGLDFGYIGGVYPAEEQQGVLARWSDGHALLRLAAVNAPGVLRLRLAAPRPQGNGATARVCAAGRCAELQLSPVWRTYTLALPPVADTELLIELRSNTFPAPDDRRLGLLIDWAEVATHNPQLATRTVTNRRLLR